MFADALSSLGVLAGGLVIALWRLYWIDPVVTIAIGLYIGQESVKILLGAVHVLMEGTPSGIALAPIRSALESTPGVKNIHHVHLWSVGEDDVHAELHVEVDDMLVSQSADLRNRIEGVLMGRFGVNHVTLQLECGGCPDRSLVKRSVETSPEHDD